MRQRTSFRSSKMTSKGMSKESESRWTIVWLMTCGRIKLVWKRKSIAVENAGKKTRLKTRAMRMNLWKAWQGLLAAAYAKPTISLDRPSAKSPHGEAKIKRALNELLPADKECMNLVRQSKTRCEHFSALLKDFNFIGLIVNEWPEFARPESRSASLRSQDGESFEG